MLLRSCSDLCRSTSQQVVLPQVASSRNKGVLQAGEENKEENLRSMHPVASLLSYLTKAPLVPDGAPVINALGRQRAALENVLRACVGLAPDHNMLLEHK